jgi:hypothetical protein
MPNDTNKVIFYGENPGMVAGRGDRAAPARPLGLTVPTARV